MSAAVPLLAEKKTPALRPNIVLVVASDFGAWMSSCYGNQDILTPNIDRLASGGTRFLNAIACTPMSSPSRATLFTGLTPSQHGIQDFLTPNPVKDPPQGQLAPPPSFANQSLISDLLSKAGYRCGYVGRWDLGNDRSPGHGLSYTCTIPGEIQYQDPVLATNGTDSQEKGFLTEILTGKACAFLDQQSKNAPFFLTVGYPNAHAPYDGQPEKYYTQYKSADFSSFGIQPAVPNALRGKEYLENTVANIRKFAASISALDAQIPVLQSKLIQKQLYDSTLFIFTSDNGLLLGRHGLWSKGHASDPVNMYEEDIHVPLIAVWPGRTPVAAGRSEIVSSYDLLPTLCEAAGAPLPAGKNLCGRSYLPLIMNLPIPAKQPWPRVAYGEFLTARMARDNSYKLIRRQEGQGQDELYDLRKDPREKLNQINNPAYVDVREQLSKQITAWSEKYGS
jgi:choline-sulfatase